jgi:broad specificity phosphatase PhoE
MLNKKFDDSTLKYGPIPVSETWDQFTSRIENFHTQMINQYVKNMKKKVLVITHGLVVKHLEETLLGNQKYQRGRDVPHLKGFII